ncbi:hypothetical protein DFQ26_002479, partial [Actinomortierella ambigua]
MPSSHGGDGDGDDDGDGDGDDGGDGDGDDDGDGDGDGDDDADGDINNLDRFFLKYAEEAFDGLSASLQAYPNKTTTRYIGIDPGVKIAAEAVLIDPTSTKQEIRAVRVSRKLLNKPTKFFNQRLRRRKEVHGIDRLESRLPPFTRDTIHEYFRFLLEPNGPLDPQLDAL